LGKTKKPSPREATSEGPLKDLLGGVRRRNLSANSLATQERTRKAFFAWTSAASLDPRALSFAYKHWDAKNQFAKIEPPIQK
jgi:hypothetical protein